MATWSISQGKYIDDSAPQQTGGQAYSGSTESTDQYSPVREILRRAALSDMKNVSKYSTALNMFPAPNTETAEIKNKREALKPASSALSRVDDKWLDQLGPQNKMAQLSLTYLGGLGVDDKTKDLDSKFQLLKQNVVRALQGARMSDVDIQMAEKYIPTIADTPSYARIKIRNLKQMIADMQGGNVSESPSKTSSPWEVVVK